MKFAGKLEDRILESQINSQEKNKNMVFLDNITEKDVSKWSFNNFKFYFFKLKIWEGV